MSPDKLYTIILGSLIILHRLPDVFVPSFFRRSYLVFSKNIWLVRSTGLILILFNGWGIYELYVNYKSPGWFVMGLSIFICIKALCYLFVPESTTTADRRANDMSNRALSMVSLAIVLGGGAVLFIGLILF